MTTTSYTSQSENPNLQSMYDRVSGSPKREYMDGITPNSTSHVYAERDNTTPSHQITQITDRVYNKVDPEATDIKQINGSSKSTRSSKTSHRHGTLASDTNSPWPSSLNEDNISSEHYKITQDADFLWRRSWGVVDIPFVNKILKRTPSIVVNRNDFTPSSPAKNLKEKILKDDLSVEEIDTMVVTLLAKKQKIESVEREDELDILFDFLSRTKIKKQELLTQTTKEIECLKEDLVSIQQEMDYRSQLNKGKKHEEGEKVAESDISHTEARSANDEREIIEDERKELDQTRKRKHTTFTRYSSFRLVNTLRYADLFNTSSIVSTIEFDRDDEYFATAGVTKKIKIFEYANIERNNYEDAFGGLASGNIRDGAGGTRKIMDTFLTYPIREMNCRTAYPGIIILNPKSQVLIMMELFLYGMLTLEVKSSHSTSMRNARGVWTLEEWILRIKIWSTNQKNSVFTLESNANLWDIDTQTCTRTYTGHINEKNFVGLSTSSDWIGCGSEDNSVVAYYKTLSKPVVKFKFGSINPVTGEETVDVDSSLFVSSVCWKNNSNTLLAANSQGTIKVLELE
ncbi:13711_t:CDS:10 [Acaulospora colombiana]|uniref:13711_t:CDS:1 n=1 Tax=Acaulospora colombiana TaxID=27376 RepID=A0ACA9L0W8_9GLOM|nr:13711_t:CDS:10 [Acaulospora colombiana]